MADSRYTGIGVMSGTSLDGVDICLVEFTKTNEKWNFTILQATTVAYDEEWKLRLTHAPQLDGLALIKLNVQYSHFLGESIGQFINGLANQVDFVGCHGHTIFHQPEEGVTYQLGDGETIAAYLQRPLVCNFRAKDVALGGQGAPLVPIGERYLFSKYDFCLNLGGIANISVRDAGIAYDVCPCNMLLNTLANQIDSSLQYDEGGHLARQGKVLGKVLTKWNSLKYYEQPPPKSLGREWFEDNILPTTLSNTEPKDILRTAIYHIAQQISSALECEIQKLTNSSKCWTLIITGGGAFNAFLLERLTREFKKCNLRIEVAEVSRETVEYKEALVFAFLALRCLQGESNISRRVTGARCDSVSGGIHLPPTGGKASSKVNIPGF